MRKAEKTHEEILAQLAERNRRRRRRSASTGTAPVDQVIVRDTDAVSALPAEPGTVHTPVLNLHSVPSEDAPTDDSYYTDPENQVAIRDKAVSLLDRADRSEDGYDFNKTP